ncbi:MAG TPA: DUF6807 family protein [Phycisphaerae bacterium]|nr:DUF6807 family protein [Phycisphaerae bacterium]
MRITRNLILAAALVACALAAPAPAADSPFSAKLQEGQYFDVFHNGRRAVRYVIAWDPDRYKETYKPFLHVFDAEGASPITNGTAAKQYPHHRGIFIGWTKLGFGGKRYGFWGMGGGVHQRHVKMLASNLAPDGAVFAGLVHWNLADGKTLIEEERTQVLLPSAKPTLALIDFTSRLTAVAGDVVLDGDPEHAGVQYRPHDDVDRKATRYLFHADGVTPGRGKDTDMPWVAEQYTLAGKTYSVQHMSHPDNPKGAEWSAYRDYGRFGPWIKKDLKKGETLAIRYRFRVTEGDILSREQYQKSWEQFAASPTPKSCR